MFYFRVKRGVGLGQKLLLLLLLMLLTLSGCLCALLVRFVHHYFFRDALRFQLATLFSWYAALLILWVRRPWYDTAWGENDNLNEADEEEVRILGQITTEIIPTVDPGVGRHEMV